MKELLVQRFREIYQREDGIAYFSPGKVNLMGSFTDFNGGDVLTCAISLGTYGMIALRDDMEVHIFCEKQSSTPYVFDMEVFFKDEDAPFSDYIKGIIAGFYQSQISFNQGFDLYVTSMIPIGVGLSYSASLEMLIALMMNDLYDLRLDKTELAQIGLYAEESYLGQNSSIIETFSIIQARKNQAILLHTQSLDFEFVTCDFKEYQLILIDPHIKNDLLQALYPVRLNECQEATDVIKPLYQINTLCELKDKELISVSKLVNEQVFNRIKHVVLEHERTETAAKALDVFDIEMFSNLMNESRISTMEKFEIHFDELNQLVDIALENEALSVKQIYAMLGGCVLALVHKEKVKKFITQVLISYETLTQIKPTFYTIRAEEGTHKL